MRIGTGLMPGAVLVLGERPVGGQDLVVEVVGRGILSRESAPRSLGPDVDSSDSEYGPTLSRDGRYLYFTSHRAGSADINRMPLSAVLGGPG